MGRPAIDDDERLRQLIASKTFEERLALLIQAAKISSKNQKLAKQRAYWREKQRAYRQRLACVT